MVLAAVTDASIIFGGDLITPTTAFIWFKFQEQVLLLNLRSAKSRYRLAELNLEKYYNSYRQSLKYHNNLYRNDTKNQWIFPKRVISIIYKCIGNHPNNNR